MKRALQVLGGVLVVVGCLWGWSHWRSSPEQQIRDRLEALAELISFDAGEGMVSAALSLDRLGSFFTEEILIDVALEGDRHLVLRGRSEILERAKAARVAVEGLEVEFLDVVVTVGEQQRSAVVEATGSARQGGARDRSIMELRFQLERTEAGWQISSIETIPMLLRREDRFRVVSRMCGDRLTS